MFVIKYKPEISKKTKDIQVNLKIERAFISILSRFPSADEKKIFLEEYELNGSAATNNMVSALISTGEFMFVQ